MKTFAVIALQRMSDTARIREEYGIEEIVSK